MRLVRRVDAAELPALAGADAHEYQSLAIAYVSDRERRRAVPSRAKELHALFLARLASEEESNLATRLTGAAEAAHVLASAEAWPELEAARVETLTYACHRGSQTRLWSASGQSAFLVFLAARAPDAAILELCDYLWSQPAWQRLARVEHFGVLAAADLLPAGPRAEGVFMSMVDSAWVAGLGTGLLDVLGKL